MAYGKSSGLVFDAQELGYLYDSSGNHHTLTNHGATPVRGKFGKGMYFDGINDYITCRADSSINIHDMIAIEMWMKELGRENMGKVLARRTGVAFYQVGCYDGVIRLMIGNGANYSIIQRTSELDLDIWYHIVTLYDINVEAGKQGKIYVNGLLDTEGTLDYNIGDLNGIDLEIGSYSADYFNGIIASVKIYNRALSAAEIAANYKSYGFYGSSMQSPKSLV